jgi:hypothetical protein
MGEDDPMARRNRRRPDDGPEIRDPRVFSTRRVEEHPDGEWVVQRITGSSSVKSYRCPGCDQLIPPATPHVVAWPFEDDKSQEERRHWHTACWGKRDRRSPNPLRGRGPQY